MDGLSFFFWNFAMQFYPLGRSFGFWLLSTIAYRVSTSKIPRNCSTFDVLERSGSRDQRKMIGAQINDCAEMASQITEQIVSFLRGMKWGPCRLSWIEYLRKLSPDFVILDFCFFTLVYSAYSSNSLALEKSEKYFFADFSHFSHLWDGENNFLSKSSKPSQTNSCNFLTKSRLRPYVFSSFSFFPKLCTG